MIRKMGSMFAMLLVAACGGSRVDVATSEAAAAATAGYGSQSDCAGAGQVKRPLEGRCETAFTMGAPVPGEAGLVFTVEFVGTCRFTHLGRTAVVATQTVVIPPEGPQTVINDAVLTAANGDELESHLEGFGTPVLLEGTDVMIGVRFEGDDAYGPGTGRFAGAAGEAFLSGAAFFDPPAPGAPPFPATGTGFYEVSGSICY